jgi:hypothetical protein
MASLADAAALTLQLRELTDELHREACDGDGDFSRMVELADRVSELADGLAVLFERTNAALEEALAEWPPLAAPAPEPRVERRPLRAVGLQALRRAWGRARRLFPSRRLVPPEEQLPKQPFPWRERPHPELLLFR